MQKGSCVHVYGVGGAMGLSAPLTRRKGPLNLRGRDKMTLRIGSKRDFNNSIFQYFPGKYIPGFPPPPPRRSCFRRSHPPQQNPAYGAAIKVTTVSFQELTVLRQLLGTLLALETYLGIMIFISVHFKTGQYIVYDNTQVFASSFDWFTGLCVSSVIGQSNSFGFGFTTIN